jgi:hypothetical protein
MIQLSLAYLFRKGEALYENYGQPNHIYFLYHGFSIKVNSYDCVYFTIEMSSKEINEVNWNKAKDIAMVILFILLVLFKLFEITIIFFSRVLEFKIIGRLPYHCA